jgi:flotillin
MNENETKPVDYKLLVGLGAIGIAGGLATRYKISKSNEWLIKTGLGIKDLQISKTFIQWPFQNIERMTLTPKSYKISINAMSKEKMEFNFPAMFTIGPKNENSHLMNYATYLLPHNEEKIEMLIKGIAEGESRSVAANLSIEDIFSARNEFKKAIVENVQTQLEQYGMTIYNANIEELTDSATSNYFKSLSQKIKADAESRAKIEVSEAHKLGQIGEKERLTETRNRVAELESIAKLSENKRDQEIVKSTADLEKTKAEQNFIVQQAKIISEQEAEIVKMKLLREVESTRSQMELEKQRAVELTKSTVLAETMVKEAEGFVNSERLKADAQLYTKQKEAEGVLALYQAQSEGLHKLVNSFGGDTRALLSYTMLEKGIYEKLAESNAKAIKDLNPKITVWTSNPADSMDTIRQLGKSVIPMLDTIKEQTGYSLPEWALKKEELK